MSSLKYISKYIKYQRGKKNLSLQDLSDLTGLTPSFLLRFEKGSYKTVSLEVLEKLSKGLNMDFLDFLYKCKLVEKKNKIYSLEFYLKEKYQLPKEAIDEVSSFIAYIKYKYKKNIKHQLLLHKQYWSQK